MPTEDRCKQIRHATATYISTRLGVVLRAQPKAFLLAALLIVLCAAAPQAWAAAATTTTTLAVTSGGSAVTTVASKTVVALTATVTAGSTAVKPGQVNFCDATAKSCTDIHLLGTAQLTNAGTASMKFRPGIGSHSYKAVFAGTKTNAASTSSASALTVTATTMGKFSTTTTIAQSGSPTSYTLAATVGGGLGPVVPTGTVSFLDTSNGNAVLGTAALVPGMAGVDWLNPQNPAPGGEPFDIAVADFNGDGRPDLAVANTRSVMILLGNGDGTFTATATSPATAATCCAAIAVGDFNGDGIPDLAVGNSDNTLTILLGNGDGTFTASAVSPATGPILSLIAADDFNGDGIPDLAVAGNGTVAILLGNGDGTFSPTATSPTTLPSGSVAVGDFNGDGIPDLAVAGNGTVVILLGNGDGTFTAMAASPATGSGSTSIVVGDFRGKGFLDLAVAHALSGNVTILLGNGDGTFTATAVSPVTGQDPLSIALGDFNGDGIPDLAAVDGWSNNVTILLGNGDGTFTATVVSPATGDLHSYVTMGDFNGNGVSDLAVAGFSETVTVLLAQPTQTATATATGISLPAGTGTHLVEASYPGDIDFLASISGPIGLVAPSIQTITFVNPGTQTYGTPLTLIATASSGLAVSFASATTSVCTVSANTVTFLTTGTCGIWATQAGNGDFSPAPEVGHAFAVAKEAQTIAFPNPGAQTYGGLPFTLSATASSNLPVSYASTTSTICTVSSSTVTLLATGTCGISATQAGNTDYKAAAAVGLTFQVVHYQIITFPAIPTTTLATGSVILNATATSHLPISYSSTNTSVCTVSGSTVTLLNFGTCGIWAAQAGNGIVPPAPQVGHAFEVTLATQTIPFARPATQWLGEMTFNLNATASSGLPVSYASTTPSICTVAGSTVTLLALGECGIWATQPGNTSYAAAPQFGHMFLVAREAQTINFTYPGEHPFGTSFTLNATASSGLPVIFTSMDTSVCTVSGSTVSLSPYHGYCGILADQAGNAYYGPAPEVGHVFW